MSIIVTNSEDFAKDLETIPGFKRLKPMPTGGPICGACKNFDFKNHKMARLYGERGNVAIATATCLKFHSICHKRYDDHPYSSICFELWEEET